MFHGWPLLHVQQDLYWIDQFGQLVEVEQVVIDCEVHSLFNMRNKKGYVRNIYADVHGYYTYIIYDFEKNRDEFGKLYVCVWVNIFLLLMIIKAEQSNWRSPDSPSLAFSLELLFESCDDWEVKNFGGVVAGEDWTSAVNIFVSRNPNVSKNNAVSSLNS